MNTDEKMIDETVQKPPVDIDKYLGMKPTEKQEKEIAAIKKLIEEKVKENSIGTIFTVNNSYTSMDEDYSYHVSIFNDGSLYIQQMESYCYEKTYTTFEKTKSENFKNKALTIINSFENEMSESWDDWYDNKNPDGRILYYDFSFCNISKFSFFKKMTGKLKQLIDEYYPGEVDWSISINHDF